MTNKLAFVLGGGGARGAFQVGALHALFTAGYKPDILVGTSVGAANAAFLALNGFSAEGLKKLTATWGETLEADLLPSNYVWLTVRTLFQRSNDYPVHRMRNFFLEHGLDEALKFKDIKGYKLLLVAADLNLCEPYVYGFDGEDSVLEGLLASTTLPPWVPPITKEENLLIDGGVVSPLALETAIQAGASEIVALDISDTREIRVEAIPFGAFLGKLANTIQNRQIALELALAEAKGIPVMHIPLRGKEPVAIWNFTQTKELIEIGFEIASSEINKYDKNRRPQRQSWIRRFISHGAGSHGGSGNRKSRR
jgi:NTE family protein